MGVLSAATGTATGYKGNQCEDPKLSPEERSGCQIWFYATAGNARFHAYVLPQRLPVLLDWYRVLNSKQRGDRFRAWGIINDPDCCTPGSKGCPKKSLAETFGMDYCPGDDQLLQFVGKPGYRDPGCDFKDAPANSADPHKGQRESPCALEFGTSSGAMGIRKFPESAVRSGEVAQGERTVSRTGAASTDGGSGDLPFEAARWLDRTALLFRHVLRRVPHRVRSSESSEGSGESPAREHQGCGRQSVHERDGDYGVGRGHQQPTLAHLQLRPAPGRSTPRHFRTISPATRALRTRSSTSTSARTSPTRTWSSGIARQLPGGRRPVE